MCPPQPQSAPQMQAGCRPQERGLRHPLSPVQGIHFPISKVDVILLLMLQQVEGDCGKGRKFLSKDYLEPKARGPGEQQGR